MQLPDNLNNAQHAALMACLRIAAQRGEELERNEQKAKLALPVGEPAASLAETTGANSLTEVCPDAS